jgi:RNA polymerase primary sigma factor
MVKFTGKVIQGNDNTTKLLNTIKQSYKQYPTLNKDQEQELIFLYKNDRETLNRLLILHNIRSVFNIAKKYAAQVDDFDSLVMDGILGLAEAAKRFDIDKNIKFITYAYVWIRKYILAGFYAKNVKIDQMSVSINSLINGTKSDESEGTLEDILNSKIDPTEYINTLDDQLSANEQKNIYNDLIDNIQNDTSLSSNDKAIFSDLFIKNEKISDIAFKFNIQPKDVTSVRKKILQKLKTYLNNEYSIYAYSDI